MLLFTETVNEDIVHQFYPIAMQASNSLIEKLGLKNVFENKIHVNSDYHAVSTSITKNKLPILNEDRFTCNVKYNLDPKSVKWDAGTIGNFATPSVVQEDMVYKMPLFYDLDNNIRLLEYDLPMTINMECSMSFIDKSLANIANNRLGTLVGPGIIVKDFIYDYRLPDTILLTMYKLMKLAGLSPDTLVTYLKEKSGNTLAINENRNTKKREVIVQKHFNEVTVGVEFNMDQVAIQNVGKSADLTVISFNMFIQISRPINLGLVYPIVVNNQLVPESILPVNKDTQYGYYPENKKMEYLNFTNFYKMKQILRAKQPVRLPWYDNWKLSSSSFHEQVGYSPFLICVFTLDNPDVDARTVLNITDGFDKYSLTETVLSYYNINKDKCLYPNTEYHIGVYMGDNAIMMEADEIQFDGQNLSISNGFGKNRIYRLILSKRTSDPLVLSTFRVMDCVIEVHREGN